MSYIAEYVANAIILKNKNKYFVKDLNQIKLQNILYFFHGWYLSCFNQRLISDCFEVGEICPIIPSLNSLTNQYKYKNVKLFKSRSNCCYVVNYNNVDFYNLLNIVMDKYIHFDVFKTTAMTNDIDSPWWNAKLSGEKILLDNNIKKYYRDLVYN